VTESYPERLRDWLVALIKVIEKNQQK